MKKSRARVLFILQFCLGLLLLIGINTFLSGCPIKEDGTWMVCHWAHRAIFGCSVILIILTLAGLIIKNPEIHIGLQAGILLVSILTVLFPGTLINTCMMAEMSCNCVMKPAVTAIGAILAVLAAINMILFTKQYHVKK